MHQDTELQHRIIVLIAATVVAVIMYVLPNKAMKVVHRMFLLLVITVVVFTIIGYFIE